MTQSVSFPPQGATVELTAQYRRKGWWPGESLVDRFERHVRADDSRRAVVDDTGLALTRGELWSRSGALARSLAESGVGAGDVVLVYLPNSVHWQVVFLACLQVGAVPATLPITTDAHTLGYIYDLVGGRAIVAPVTHRGRPTGEWAQQLAHSCDRSATVLLLEDGAEKWTQVEGAAGDRVVPPGVDHLMFTSSTTGMPKAVMHSNDTLASVNLAFMQRFGVNEDTPIYMPSPLGHSVGAWHGARLSLFTGAMLVLQDRWDPVRGLQLVDEHSCAFTAAATPFLNDILDAPWAAGRPKLASLRSFLCGGAPVPPSLLEQALSQAPHTFVTVLWGMTEGAGTTCVPESTTGQLTGTAGTPVPDLELKILDPDEHGVGELAMRGPQVFLGYLGQESLYRELLTEEGFFRTGDLATIGDDGYLRLAGRLKDLIIRGGVNISPVPIEDAIAAHPAVRRVAVIGESDERLGERICAVIVPNGAPPTLEALNAWLVEQGLSTRKLPESLRIVEDMPVTAAGKIRKPELRTILEGN